MNLWKQISFIRSFVHYTSLSNTHPSIHPCRSISSALHPLTKHTSSIILNQVLLSLATLHIFYLPLPTHLPLTTFSKCPLTGPYFCCFVVSGRRGVFHFGLLACFLHSCHLPYSLFSPRVPSPILPVFSAGIFTCALVIFPPCRCHFPPVPVSFFPCVCVILLLHGAVKCQDDSVNSIHVGASVAPDLSLCSAPGPC